MAHVTPVFIPGLLCTEWLFHGQADISSGKAVFADTRHHGTITGMAEAALAQVSGQLVPIGLSMGGYVALEMARLAPARISAMALFSTNCRQDNDAQRAGVVVFQHQDNRAPEDGVRKLRRRNQELTLPGAVSSAHSRTGDDASCHRQHARNGACNCWRSHTSHETQPCPVAPAHQSETSGTTSMASTRLA